jgi:hypothetical protein
MLPRLVQERLIMMKASEKTVANWVDRFAKPIATTSTTTPFEGCSMSRLIEQQETDVVCEYYGINKRTFKVECVSETKGGILSLMRGGNYITHLLEGKEGHDECVAVFDLVEIRPMRGPMLADQALSDTVRSELRDKSAEMRMARNKAAPT